MGDHQLQTVIVGEFDDGALMKAFGRAGAGFFLRSERHERRNMSSVQSPGDR